MCLCIKSGCTLGSISGIMKNPILVLFLHLNEWINNPKFEWHINTNSMYCTLKSEFHIKNCKPFRAAHPSMELEKCESGFKGWGYKAGLVWIILLQIVIGKCTLTSSLLFFGRSGITCDVGGDAWEDITMDL